MRVSVIGFATESLFLIHSALKIRFGLGWFPNQNSIMLCFPVPSQHFGIQGPSEAEEGGIGPLV